jgi:TM2 domain-containing membrane protein YozV
MREERSVGMAYMLWIPCLFGLCGIHRFYAGRWATGLLWFFTGALCFVGQLVDLFLIPGMVDAYNRGESRL